MLILVDWDSNCVKLIPLKPRKTDSCVTACQEGCNWFQQHGVKATLLKLDNEISNTLINVIRTDGLRCQLALPEDHRQLPAQRAIQDAKAHFMSIMGIADTQKMVGTH